MSNDKEQINANYKEMTKTDVEEVSEKVANIQELESQLREAREKLQEVIDRLGLLSSLRRNHDSYKHQLEEVSKAQARAAMTGDDLYRSLSKFEKDRFPTEAEWSTSTAALASGTKTPQEFMKKHAQRMVEYEASLRNHYSEKRGECLNQLKDEGILEKNTTEFDPEKVGEIESGLKLSRAILEDEILKIQNSLDQSRQEG